MIIIDNETDLQRMSFLRVRKGCRLKCIKQQSLKPHGDKICNITILIGTLNMLLPKSNRSKEKDSLIFIHEFVE